MIYAMHQIQLACLVRHGRSAALRDFTAEAAAHQLLLASATTEVGTGGDIRSSRCAVETTAGTFALEKSAPVISYGEDADAILATARRSGDAAVTDQVLVVCRRPGLELTASSHWDALGMRGTCSPGFLLQARGEAGLILDDPFSDILAQTMLPVSHALWASVWLGIATEAVLRARNYIQAQARRENGHTPRGATRLAAAVAKQQEFRVLVRGTTEELDHTQPGDLANIRTAIRMNSLKLSAAALVVDIVGQALLTTGLAGYRDHGLYSMGRLLRDAYSASIMVNDDRITDNTAQLLLMSRERTL
jgi:acyl-CoA dehydrogenase